MEEREWLPGTARQRIQTLLKGNKVSQVKLAEETGIDRSKISRFISGASDSLSHEDIIKIAHFFKVSTDFLLGETNFSARRNYNIEELGLSLKAAKKLYTQSVNPQIICQLIEHDKCGELTLRIELYQEGIQSAGIAAQNQIFDSLRGALAEHVQTRPEDKEAAIASAQRVKAMKQSTQATELEGINQLFTQILKDIKKAGPDAEHQAKVATKEAMAEMIATTAKGEDGLNLKRAMPSVIMDGILQGLPAQMKTLVESAPEELKPEAERIMQRLGEDLEDYLSLLQKAQQRRLDDE